MRKADRRRVHAASRQGRCGPEELRDSALLGLAREWEGIRGRSAGRGRGGAKGRSEICSGAMLPRRQARAVDLTTARLSSIRGPDGRPYLGFSTYPRARLS